MQSSIKPIETFYRGYRFRSRLEARWAVFFDALEIGWEYEPEAFSLDGVGYLPDFRLTGKFKHLPRQIYAEVKAPKHKFPHSKRFSDLIAPIVNLEGPPGAYYYGLRHEKPFTATHYWVFGFDRGGGAVYREKWSYTGEGEIYDPDYDLTSAVAEARRARFERFTTAEQSLHV